MYCTDIQLVDDIEEEVGDETEVQHEAFQRAGKAGILVDEGYPLVAIYHQQNLGCPVWGFGMH